MFAIGVVVLVVMFSLLILAVLLRAACYLLNEPVPELGYSLAIVIVQTVLGGIAVAAVQVLFVGAIAVFFREPSPALLLLTPVLTVPAKAAVCAAVYWKMLSVSFAKGIGLFLVQGLILTLLLIAALFIGSFIGPIFAA